MSLDAKNTVKQTYFGVVSLLLAILSVIFLAVFFVLSQMNIMPATFFFWNNVMGLVYCITTPASFFLAILAWRGKKDSRRFAWVAIIVITIPFLVLFAQFVFAFLP